MSDRPSDNLGGLDIETARRIDEVCRRFEANWREGCRPRVADYLVDVSPEGRPALRAELEALERELRPSEEIGAGKLRWLSDLNGHRRIMILGQGFGARIQSQMDDEMFRPCLRGWELIETKHIRACRLLLHKYGDVVSASVRVVGFYDPCRLGALVVYTSIDNQKRPDQPIAHGFEQANSVGLVYPSTFPALSQASQRGGELIRQDMGGAGG